MGPYCPDCGTTRTGQWTRPVKHGNGRWETRSGSMRVFYYPQGDGFFRGMVGSTQVRDVPAKAIRAIFDAISDPGAGIESARDALFPEDDP